MEKMKMESIDMVSHNVALLQKVFPNCVTEGIDASGERKLSVDMEILQQMLSDTVLPGDEAYQLSWVGKKAAIVEANRSIRKTLRPVIPESKNWDGTENLYIEGDNLDTLKLLQESYLGAVKLIYIDPPYNTGHDFVYPDSFIMDNEEYANGTGYFDEDGNVNFSRENSETAGKYHSDWCSMIYSRLMLARNLLSDDGIILINMDENEISNLQKICSEVFGEANDLGTIVWDKRNPKGDARGISYQHEYIVVYAKNKMVFTEKCKMQRPKKNAETIVKKANALFSKVGVGYSLEQANTEFGAWMRSQTDFSGGERAYNKIDKNGEVYRPVSMAWPNKKKAPDDYFIPLIHPVTKKPCPVPERGWRNPSATMKKMMEEGRILFGKDETTIPNSKYLLKDNMYENIPSLLYYGGSDTDMLSQMKIPFDTPKVVSICKEHIKSFTGDGDIILDFFSGSATVAHAVMESNADDGLRRKYIMVQVPETISENTEAYRQGYRNICEIGKDRIRRAGEKIKEETGAQIDYGFRVLRIDESNMNDVYYSAGDYSQGLLTMLESNVKTDRNSLDLLFGCLLEWGLPLSLPYSSEKIEGCTVHNYNDGDLIACFDENIPDSVIKAVAKMQPLRAVFRDSSFANSPAKINVGEIFKLLAPDTTVKVI
ncbi:site-specific DNA-methyltransferase [bacterium 210820-DFI.6.37]|nr:site-specific DNA-methyltransferase [bacterium 210820-DFI.6.37]